jgi:transcriptional regulator with XRE-family HTH domain
MTKLDKDTVKRIKGEISEKLLTQKQLGKKYGVSRSVISDIACGRVHKDVKSEVDMDERDTQIFRLRSDNEHLREERNNYKRQLKSAAKTQGLFQAVVDEMDDRIKPMKPLPSQRPKFKPDRNSISEHLVMHISDGHHDQIVTPNDTGGLETYDFPISMCRAERYVDTLLKWTQQTLQGFTFPSLTVLAYGDHTSGEIHGHTSRSYFRNAFKNAFAIGQLHSLMYRDLAPYFDQVNIVYVPGNHGRRSNKKDYHGAHDNWDYLIAKTAEMYLRDLPNVSFNIPNSFSCNLDIGGVGFQIFHGDDIRSSLGIPWYGLEKRRHRMMALNGVQNCTPIRYYCCGHFHRPGSTTEVNGEMLINGAWPASDAYAFNALGGFTEPSQLIHGVNKEYGITWRLPVKLRCPYEATGPRRYKIDQMDEIAAAIT